MTRLDPADERVISAHHAGRKLVFLGDTCDSSKIADMAKGATVLVHEVRRHRVCGLAAAFDTDTMHGDADAAVAAGYQCQDGLGY